MKIAIIGAGHAGVEAAISARKAGAQTVVIFSREAVLPYFRPRLPEIAFGSGDVSTIALHPEEWYAERGIRLRLDTPVTDVDVDDRALTIQTPDGSEIFDAVVFASGATPRMPVIPGIAGSPFVYSLWTAEDAKRINRQIKFCSTIGILGGGILGFEMALRARKMGLEVHLLEKENRLMPQQFDAEASEYIYNRLKKKGVKIHTGCTVNSAEHVGSKISMTLSSQKRPVDVDIILYAVGSTANFTLAQNSGLTVDRGVYVDSSLQTSAPTIYAAGDVARLGTATRCSVRNAIIQGRVAGHNAVASVTGVPAIDCPKHDIPLLFKTKELEFHSWGKTLESAINGTIERLDDGKDDSIYRAVVKRTDGVIVGVQMIGTDEGFEELVKSAR